MAVTKLTFGSVNIQGVIAHSVYIRAEWGFDWTLAANVHCDEATWSVAPTMPTATLFCEYGDIARPGALAFTKESRRGYLRSFCKIVFTIGDGDSSDGTMTWYGIVELQDDHKGGAVFTVSPGGETTVWATGEQTFAAFGLEHLLAVHTVRTSLVKHASEHSTVSVGRGICFNEGGIANRNNIKMPDAYPFASSSAIAEHWSTRDIVEYLLWKQTPSKADGTVAVPFYLDIPASAAIPNWDSPELEQDQAVTYDLLTVLMSRQRLLSWYLRVDETTTPDTVYLMPFTATANDVSLDLPNATPIPANASQVHLVFDADRSGVSGLRVSALDTYDQFIVRGARRRSCFSVNYTEGTIEDGWAAAAETEYEAGASGATGFPSSSEINERRRWHAEARSRKELADVFRRFAIPEDWNATDGTTEGRPVFPVLNGDEVAAEPAPYYPLGLTVESTMPLLEGVDYSGDKIGSGTVDTSDATDQEMGPLVAWELPNTTPQRYQNVEQIGRKSDLEVESPDENESWSCEVIVPPNDRAVQLIVHGQPAHVIADVDFSGQPEDDVTGEHDYLYMVITLSVPDDRFAEGVYPDDTSLDVFADTIRRKVIYAGDSFRHDYVVPETVVGIDDDGTLITSDGGFVNDDTAELRAVARVAWEWYGIERYVLQFETDQPTSLLSLGDLVVQIGDDTVNLDGHHQTEINSPVTSLQIRTPRHLGAGEPEPPRMAITTGWGELDPMQLSFGDSEGDEDEAYRDGRRDAPGRS